MASRFLGNAFPIKSPEDFELHREAEQKRYYDATHWCWAMRLGRGNELLERSSDAGEPRGTAGLPILRELQSRQVTDCAIIVTRYFGGTKLGTGNLGRAYGECAAAALRKCKVTRRVVYESLRVSCDYDDQGSIYHWSGQHAAVVEPLEAVGHSEFLIKVRCRNLDALTQKFVDETAGRVKIERAGQWIS
jgi:uncharacterized YigZ family protein